MDPEAYSSAVFVELIKKLKHSILFVHEPLFNYLHYHGGYPNVAEQGQVKFILNLTDDQKIPQDCPKAVFLVNSKITDPQIRDAIRSIVKNGKFEYCIIITTAAISCHDVEEGVQNNIGISSSINCVQQQEHDLLMWMGNKNYTAEVLHIPLFIAALSDDAFLCPPFHNLIPHLDNKFFHSDIDYLPADQKSAIDIFSRCLHNFLNCSTLNQEIYCVGPTSSILGQKLAGLYQNSKAKRQASGHDSVSLVLIDRNADLLTPLIGAKSSTLDYILAGWPDFAALQCKEKTIRLNEQTKFPAFTIFDALNRPDAGDFVQKIIEKPIKQCVEVAAAHMAQMIHSHFPDYKISDQSDLNQLLEDYWLLSVKSQQWDNFVPLYQMCSGLSKTDQNHFEQYDKIFQQAEILCSLPSCSTEDFLTDFVEFSAENNLKFRDDLSYLVAFYSMAAQNALKWNEDDLKSYLISKFAKEQSKRSTSSDSIESVKELFSKLKNVARLRHVLGEQNYRTPYVENLLNRIFDRSRPNLEELSCKTSTFKLPSLNSLFGSSNSSRPSDSKICILFILGGITGYEIACVRRKFKELHLKRTEKQIFIGSTSFISSDDVFDEFSSFPGREIREE